MYPSDVCPYAGSSLIKPRPNWSLIVSLLGSVDALTRGLALDLAPTRVNVVCPGAVDTEVGVISRNPSQ